MPVDSGELRIEGVNADDHVVPVDVLVRMLNGLQQMALLFAAASEQQQIQQRFKPSTELRSRYKLHCGIPATGSYIMPVSLVDTAAQGQLGESPPILDNIRDFIEAVSTEDANRIRTLMPDSRIRERLFRELRTIGPKAGEAWTASFVLPGESAAMIDSRVTQISERLLSSGVEEHTVTTVTGELIGIDFDSNRLTLRYPVTNRELECSYLPEIEDDLLESRRGPIQVTGTFIVDADGHPSRLTNVTRIEPVDFAPLSFKVIQSGKRKLVVTPELRLVPHLDDDSQQLYVVDEPSLDLCVHAQTREELATEIAAHLLFAWDEYAKADPSTLTKSAQDLRVALLARFKEG